MNQKELKELIEFLIEKDIAEFELERGDVKVRIKRGTPEAVTPSPTERIVTAQAASHQPQVQAPLAGAPVPASRADYLHRRSHEADE